MSILENESFAKFREQRQIFFYTNAEIFWNLGNSDMIVFYMIFIARMIL